MDLARQVDPQELEEGFARESRGFLVDRTRFLIRVGTPMYLAFWLLDVFTAPEWIGEFLVMRLAAAVLFFSVYLVTYTRLGKKAIVPLSVVVIYLAALEIAIMTTFLGGFHSTYYVGIMIVCFVAGFYLPWRLPATLVFCAASLASYFGVNFYVFGAEQLHRVAEPAFFLGATCFFMAFATVAGGRRRRRDLELRLQLEKVNQELKELDEAKTRFFANVSHELRTPLTLILGPLESLLLEPIDPGWRELLETVSSNARRLLRQVNAMLEVAKIEAGKLQIKPETGNLGRLIANLVAAAEPYAAARNIRLFSERLDEVPDSRFDPEKMEIVVANLLSNAIKFSPPEGRVGVSAGSVGEKVVFQVEDTGPGIPADRLERIFDRFYQVDSSPSREQEGTGLGLALTRELVQMHGGTVKAYSHLGVGSRFVVEMPREAVDLTTERRRSYRRREDQLAAVRLEAVAASGYASKKKIGTLLADIASPKLHGTALTAGSGAPADAPRVLVVEDHADLCTFVARSLAAEYRVETAGDGLEGLEVTRRTQPDIILADIMLPRMDGYELCRLVREDALLASTPIILVTAKTGSEAVVEGLKVGANDYLTKPFDMNELKARIAAQLRARNLERNLEERESRLAAIEQMTSAIIEVLRNPVDNVMRFAEMAHQDAVEIADPSAFRDELFLLLKEAKRLQHMLEEILDFTRTSSTHLHIQPTPVRSFLNQLVEQLGSDLKRYGIELETDLRLGAELEVPLDRSHMHRVIENLFVNARNALSYWQCGGRENRVWFRAEVKSGDLVIRIADNGPGIPKELAGQLFEPFTAGGKKRGAGLGLVTVRNLVKAHHGDVYVEARAPEGGAAFTLRLPCRPSGPG